MKVSVIVPCYNQAVYLAQALQSVLDQGFQDWECLIVNDGSTDDTEAIAKQWLVKDQRFSYYYKTNGGLPQTRNYGIERAKGTYILPLDADDYISENYIASCVNELELNNTRLVYGKVEQFGIRAGIWNRRDYSFNELLKGNMIHCSAMYRRKDWQAVGGYDESMVFGLEDWEFWIRLINENDQVILLKNITFFYRIKEVSMITKMDKEKEKEIKEYVFIKHASKYFESYYDLILAHKNLNIKLQNKSFVFKSFIKLISGVKK